MSLSQTSTADPPIEVPIGTNGQHATLLAAARLDATASLAVFRAVLGALARPGSVVDAPAPRPRAIPPVLLPALALADLEVGVAVLDDARGDDHEHPDENTNGGRGAPIDWGEVVRANTGARRADALDTADMVVALRPPTGAEIAGIRTGDAFAPEHGARLVVACDGFDHGTIGESTVVEITGPGAGDGRSVQLAGVRPELIDALATANAGFPAGIDTWFVDAAGAMVALSRSSRVSVVATPGRTH